MDIVAIRCSAMFAGSPPRLQIEALRFLSCRRGARLESVIRSVGSIRISCLFDDVKRSCKSISVACEVAHPDVSGVIKYAVFGRAAPSWRPETPTTWEGFAMQPG